MTFSSFKSHAVVGILMIAVINVIGTYFSGHIVARLPFEPFSLLRGITHRNIPGENFYEAAYLLPYILIAFVWRSNLKKFLGINIKDLSHPSLQFHSLNPLNTSLSDYIPLNPSNHY